MKQILLIVAFLLELVAFFFFAALPFTLKMNQGLQIVLSLLLLASLVTFWGIFMSPKATKKFSHKSYYLGKLIIYSLASLGVLLLTSLSYFFVFIIAFIIDECALRALSSHAEN